MRVVINEARLERNRRISHILFFVSLAGMGIGFFYTWTNPTDSSSLSCMILPVLLFMTLTSVRMANNWIREPRPVNALSDALKGLGQKYTIFHHLLPAPHVLIAPEGVFTIHTVWQERTYTVNGSKWSGDRGIGRWIMGYMRQDLIGNPFADAQFEAQQMQRLIDKIAPDSGVEVQPLIVFINPAATFEATDPLFPVLYADPKAKPSLRGWLRDQQPGERPTLSDEDLDEIDRMYNLMTRDEIAALDTGNLEYDPEQDVLYETAESTSATSTSGSDGGEQPAPGQPTDAAAATGSVFVARDGQLYYIGSVEDSVERELASLQENAKNELELIHTFASSTPQATVNSFQKRFARKEQKEGWYGLSRKDIAWIRSHQDEAITS